ncbi:MAG: CoB--CoM heterodisulfide reductase iron-sulfur subunit B family protein [Actinobacteria bacterium]|nr:CoB--CoM heterodisulfide reductase iron-sulfur subunit B family protein [Actinomycetota bacterium]MCG2817717.1 CoB--CoM heterodisulfide reductase iron-sulfur subunit B family protein [Actinomycetes bacterium]MBU4179793.1 CoB--CoM heterodisulfide reductase iron-sulfur subunit B family protein [Actinomycetota bacterium]MBU4217509.1 CoB--CoM heterodisulfide reductase iron-sulfur subunit B family protein [Actinomycetota bacterium]MBU4358214.1 CoB--CoM heterodisulfide reductase iron-sulfur subuni
MSGDYTLFPGCMIPLRYPQIETAARKCLPAVGIGLEEYPGFTCCPEPWTVKGTGLEEWLAVAMRNLAVGENSGRDLLVLCNGCYSTLREASHILSVNPEAAKAAEKKLSGLKVSYKGKVEVRHVASVLAGIGPEKIAKSVKRPLEGLKVAVHHGCHLLRPSSVMEFDDPFEPSILEDLVAALGAEAVRYEGYTDCCGRALNDVNAGLAMAEEKVRAMEEAGADCLALVCPACFEQFDLGQVEMKRHLKKEHHLPAFHYCQLLALAQGEDPDALGLSRHKIKVKPLHRKLGL